MPSRFGARFVADDGHDGPDVIDFSTLGPVSIRRGTTDLESVMAQPKRLSLLAFLAVATPGGYLRRDTIVGTFWPESDPERGRAALRQAIRFLRRELGSEVIASRGAEELGVATPPLRCDALRFMRLVDEGEPERALELYRGAFLAGVYVPAVPEFDRWLEEVRGRFSAAAVEAAWRASERAERDGRSSDATSWAAWATTHAPADERGVRRRIAMLDAHGDRAAAIEVFERFAAEVRREYGLDPAPETLELVDAIRARATTSAGARRQESDGEAAEIAEAETARPSSPPLESKRVVVAALENRTSDAGHDAIGSMASDWIAQGLVEAGVFEVVPFTWSMTSTRRARALAGAAASDDGVRVVAEDTGAGTVVTGAYYGAGPSLQFVVRVVDAVRGTFLSIPAPVEASADRLLDAIAELREWVVTVLAPRHDPRAGHVRAASKPPSFQAYQAYVEGIEAFIRGDWPSARRRFDRSAAIEPSYALPQIVAAITEWNLGLLQEAAATLRRIERSELDLGRFERDVLQMVQAWLRGDWRAAHEASRRQAELAPGSIAHFQVAEEARRLNRLHEAKAVLAEIDPTRGEMRGFPFYWDETCQVHHMLGYHDEELHLARRAREHHPNTPGIAKLEVRALAACGRVEELRRVMDTTSAAPPSEASDWGSLARESGLELLEHGHPDASRDLLERSLSWYLRQRGADPPSSHHRQEVGTAQYLCGDRDRAYEVFTALVAEDTRMERGHHGHHGHLLPHFDLGYVAVLAKGRGDHVEAARVARALDEARGRFLYGRNAYWLAVLAADEGDATAAVAMLTRAFSEGLPHQVTIHADPHLASLRGTPGYQELMRPKG